MTTTTMTMVNPTLLSLHNSIRSTAFSTRQDRGSVVNDAVRISGFPTTSESGSGSLSVAVRSASSSSQSGVGFPRIEAEQVTEKTRKQIFEDGFAVFPQAWSETDIAAAGVELMLGSDQVKVLKSFLMDPIDVVSQQQWLHAPGHRCTDAATSPEPYWHHSWQIAGMEGEDLQTPLWSATLIVSLSDRNAKTFCGGVAVFPRSHWIVSDRIANSSPFPQPCDVPAAAAVELRLERGDMALLHPLLAYSIAPNVSASPAQLLVFHLGDAASKRGKSRVDRSEQMWSRWHAMAGFLTEPTTSVAVETMQLRIEEEKAQLGGWQETVTTGMPMEQLKLANLTPGARIAPRDFLAWQLRSSAVQYIQDGQWSSALTVLLRRAGLRPSCYWTALQAGHCCMESAPAGQLGGRAGRKCTLEDGERFLLRAIQISPGWPLAYAAVMRCLALMGRGRELEIPQVMETMKLRCQLEQLCLRYPIDADVLQECWNDCEARCHRYDSVERS